MLNGTEIRPVAAALIHWERRKDGRTDTTELTVAFRDYAQAPQNAFQNFISSLVSSAEPNVITCN
jgi:hypothetical protein